MRRLEQPGPASPTRVQSRAAAVRAVDVVLPAGVALLQGIADVTHAHGANSAVLSLEDAILSPMAFVMPALSTDPGHVAYFSERHEAHGMASIEAGCITFGQKDGEPWFHAHAHWRDAIGVLQGGHLLPDACLLAAPLSVRIWLLDGAAFVVRPDAETNFSLFQVEQGPRQGDGSDALVALVRPNEDLCETLEALCAAHGVRRGVIRGGVGSLIGASFTNGTIVEPPMTEVFIRAGSIEPDDSGRLRSNIVVGLVDNLGQLATGTLRRGDNPVLITFEIVIEVLERVADAH